MLDFLVIFLFKYGYKLNISVNKLVIRQIRKADITSKIKCCLTRSVDRIINKDINVTSILYFALLLLNKYPYIT